MNWHVGPVLTLLALDKNWVQKILVKKNTIQTNKQTDRNWPVGPVLTLLALDKIQRIQKRFSHVRLRRFRNKEKSMLRFWYRKCVKNNRMSHMISKNAAKRSRQRAGKKYREYAQRRVCFVNEQVPWPHSNINVKFCTSRLCMKKSSFSLFAHGHCRVYYIYHVEFHFQFEHFRFNISCPVAVEVSGHQKKVQVIFSKGGGQIIFLRSSSF